MLLYFFIQFVNLGCEFQAFFVAFKVVFAHMRKDISLEVITFFSTARGH